jgi:hypothetical protein
VHWSGGPGGDVVTREIKWCKAFCWIEIVPRRTRVDLVVAEPPEPLFSEHNHQVRVDKVLDGEVECGRHPRSRIVCTRE